MKQAYVKTRKEDVKAHTNKLMNCNESCVTIVLGWMCLDMEAFNGN
jgi:hypothetical protein